MKCDRLRFVERFDDAFFCLNHGLGGFMDFTDFNYLALYLIYTIAPLVL